MYFKKLKIVYRARYRQVRSLEFCQVRIDTMLNLSSPGRTPQLLMSLSINLYSRSLLVNHQRATFT